MKGEGSRFVLISLPLPLPYPKAQHRSRFANAGGIL